jgi:hypothetical protein
LIRNEKTLLAIAFLAPIVFLASVTIVNLATQVTGILPCANFPVLTGNVTTSSGSCATTVAAVPVTKGGIATAALTAATTVSVDFSTATVFTLTPAQAETINATNCTAGETATIVVTTSGTTTFTLTFSTNFKTTGTLATGTTTAKVFAISFRCNGTTATEIARTTAM